MIRKHPLAAGFIVIAGLIMMCCFLFPVVGPAFFRLPEVAPLSKEVIEDLCFQLELPKTDPLCDGSGEVRERDFFPRIKDAIENGKLQTQKDWEERFGAYLVECNEVAKNADGIKPTRCKYNFDGDWTYSISVEFLYGRFDRIFYLKPDSP